MSNEYERNRTQRRGGGRARLSLDFESGDSRYQIEPVDDLTPEKLYERRWVLTLLDQVLQRLRTEMASKGKEHYFDQLKTALTGDATAAEYQQSGKALGISVSAAKQAAYRMRKRYRQLFREEVLRTLSDEQELEDELGHILEILEK